MVYQPRVPSVLQAMEPWVSKAGLGDSNSRGQVPWPPPGPAPTAQQFTVVQPHLEPEMVGGHLVSFPGQEPSCLLPCPKLQPGWPGQVTDRHFVCPEGRLSWEMSQQVVRQLKENGGGVQGRQQVGEDPPPPAAAQPVQPPAASVPGRTLAPDKAKGSIPTLSHPFWGLKCLFGKEGIRSPYPY